MDLFSDRKEPSVLIREAMAELEAELFKLKQELSRVEYFDARVFKLPRAQAGEEHQPYEYLESDPVTGEEAVALATGAYSEFYGGSGASTKSVYRLPGVVAIRSGATTRIRELVSAVNDIKERFAAATQLIEDKNTRFDTVHRLFPMLITLQVTRQIQCYEEEMRSVTFTWGRKSSIKVVSRDDLLESLKRMRSQKPLAFEEDRWHDVINEDMMRLLSLPRSVELRYRRDLKVRPMANLLLTDGTKWLREGNLPIILLNPAEDFRIGTLASFNANEKPKRGRKNPQRLTEDERYLTSLPVYRAKDTPGA